MSARVNNRLIRMFDISKTMCESNSTMLEDKGSKLEDNDPSICISNLKSFPKNSSLGDLQGI